MLHNFFAGKRLLKQEVRFEDNKEFTAISDSFHQDKAIVKNKQGARCVRCNSVLMTMQHQFVFQEELVFYCPFCLNMGLCKERAFLYRLKKNNPVIASEYAFSSNIELTPFQQQISDQLVAANKDNKDNKDVLVQAVTGAGKTEMFYQVVDANLRAKKRVAICCPRVDVCLELFNRLQPIFKLPIALLHGKQPMQEESTQLVICTTHQLLRFYHAFDLIIVDEVDAFPFQGNLLLAHALKSALKPQGRLIYLSATPTKALLKSGVKVLTLSRRYHGFPLPQPKLIFCYKWQTKIKQGRLPKQIKESLVMQLKNKRRTLLFCPTLAVLEKLYRLLVENFNMTRIEKVSAQDGERTEKIDAMRLENIQIFLTTTILERGITFSDIDVFVIGSEHFIFNESALVQISGRVGRKAAYPNGLVCFFHDGQTKAMKQCVKKIAKMNRLAHKEGVG